MYLNHQHETQIHLTHKRDQSKSERRGISSLRAKKKQHKGQCRRQRSRLSKQHEESHSVVSQGLIFREKIINGACREVGRVGPVGLAAD